MNKNDVSHILIILLSIIIIIFDEYIYHNINHIISEEKECKCAQTEYLPSILKLIRFILVCDIILLLSTILLYQNIKLPYIYEVFIAILAIITLCVQLYYLYLLLRYLTDINISSCNCVDKSFTRILNIYTVIAFGMIIFDLIISYFIDVHIINKLNIIPIILKSLRQ